MSTWIKRSEREPTAADLPILAGAYEDGKWSETAWLAWHLVGRAIYTHWRSVKADPPPRELTQAEKDEQQANDVAVRVIERCTEIKHPISLEVALQAFYAERREVAKLVAALFPCFPNWGKESHFSDEWKQLRAHLDEQGGTKQ